MKTIAINTAKLKPIAVYEGRPVPPDASCKVCKGVGHKNGLKCACAWEFDTVYEDEDYKRSIA